MNPRSFDLKVTIKSAGDKILKKKSQHLVFDVVDGYLENTIRCYVSRPDIPYRSGIMTISTSNGAFPVFVEALPFSKTHHVKTFLGLVECIEIAIVSEECSKLIKVMDEYVIHN